MQNDIFDGVFFLFFAPSPLRPPSVPAPTVYRLFNGFWSEGGRSGVGPGTEGLRLTIVFGYAVEGRRGSHSHDHLRHQLQDTYECRPCAA